MFIIQILSAWLVVFFCKNYGMNTELMNKCEVLEDFLNRHRKEVRNMVLTEFDEEKFLKMVREEERAEGRIEGMD